MYYIRLHQYGQIAWGTMGYVDYLKLDRYKPSNGMCLPKEFKTIEDAERYATNENNYEKKYFGKSTYHVESFDSDFVQNWVKENDIFYKIIDGEIVNT